MEFEARVSPSKLSKLPPKRASPRPSLSLLAFLDFSRSHYPATTLPGCFWRPDTHHSLIQKPTGLAAETCLLCGPVYSVALPVVTCDSDCPLSLPLFLRVGSDSHPPASLRCPFKQPVLSAQAIDKVTQGSCQQRGRRGGPGREQPNDIACFAIGVSSDSILFRTLFISSPYLVPRSGLWGSMNLLIHCDPDKGQTQSK